MWGLKFGGETTYSFLTGTVTTVKGKHLKVTKISQATLRVREYMFWLVSYAAC
jgi:hypothetical protein